MRKSFEIIVPIYNEEESFEVLFHRLQGAASTRPDLDINFIFINDGSRDRSAFLLDQTADQHTSCKVIHLSRNFGHQLAVTAGLAYSTADYVAIIDADLQDPPEVMMQMLGEVENGWDVVYGQRISRQGETWFKIVTARAFYRLLTKMTHVSIPLDTGDFRVMSRKAVDAINNMKEHHRFLRGMVAWTGFKNKPFPYARDSRFAGETKYPFSKMFKFAFDAIFSFSDVPLRMSVYLGFATCLLGLFGVVYVAIEKLFFSNYIPGVSGVLFAVFLLGGVQLVTIGIIGQYIGRIFDEVKNRPLYLVQETKNFEEVFGKKFESIQTHSQQNRITVLSKN
jgi:polyisoprenyl-phosphate glycosyltransferase